jgi:hypothetical protein
VAHRRSAQPEGFNMRQCRAVDPKRRYIFVPDPAFRKVLDPIYASEPTHTTG